MDAQNRNTFDPKFICPQCSFILWNPVQFSMCGHRLCHFCFQILPQQDKIRCPQCQIESPRNEILFDRGFANDMQSLSITCSHCNWTGIVKDYEKHLNQSHPNPKCNYCDQQFDSINNLNQHKAFHCTRITVECLLKNFGCHQQISRSELKSHYLTKQHQDSILNVIQALKSQISNSRISSSRMNTDISQTATTIDNDFAENQLEVLQQTIDLLEHGTLALNEDLQRINTESLEYESKFQRLIDNIGNVKVAVEEQRDLVEATMQSSEFLKQHLESMKEKIDDLQYVSYDGTFVWKITNVKEKMGDAQSERQTSIYSPPFYSSPNGYKMRARLYLNGDGNARRTHMSLFFVLMRGPYDAILKFPFNYKVTFCLYDQTPQQRHIIDSFRPDIKSNSFQRPRSEMNIASGIPKFVSLEMIQQEGNPYVKEETMFIKVMVYFGDMPKSLLAYALSLDPGMPPHVQQQLIREEAQRRQREQLVLEIIRDPTRLDIEQKILSGEESF